MAILEGNEVWSTGPKRTQVYLATHDGEGNRLPFMNRSFISFSYGGKPIEDFNLIATFNDRLEKNVYADFEDSTSNYETLDGQYFWGTHFQANQLSFTLATDGMTQQQLDEFKRYFMPGVEKELILAEHPNRAILARVSAAPSVSLLPFEEQMTIEEKILGSLTVTTTLYKGSINLSFVMDEPFWYSKMNYISAYVDKDTLEPLSMISKNENGEEVFSAPENSIYTLNSKDFLKIHIEDGVPFESQLVGEAFFLGNDILVRNAGSIVGGAIVGRSYLELGSQQKTNVSVNNSQPQYLFYHGTAPAKPTIQFEMTPKILGGNFQVDVVEATDIQKLVYEDGTLYGEVENLEQLQYQLNNGILESTEENLTIGNDGRIKKIINVNDNAPFIINPINSIGTKDFNIYSSKYSYISIKTSTGKENYFYFTTPSIWTGYNQAIKLIANTKNDEAILELKEHLRDEIKEYYSRSWALKSLENVTGNFIELKMTDAIRANLFIEMQKFLQDENGAFFPASFSFNSATGEAIGTFKYLNTNNEEITIEENVGDMVKSPYLLIKEKTNFYTVINNNDLTYYEISSNEELENFKILYKNMYL